MPYVVMLSGAAKGKAIKLEGAVTIGRHKSCELVIRLAQISRRHAQIKPTLGGWIVTDLGTQNGTQVNGQTVAEHTLQDGDEIAISSVKMRFRDEAAMAAEQARAAAAAPPGAPALAPATGPRPATEDDDGPSPAASPQEDSIPSIPAGSGIRFGLGSLARSEQAAAENDPSEGTAFMDMNAILATDKEATGFIDMKELMLGDERPTLPTGPIIGMVVVIVVLLAVLGGVYLFKKPPPEPKKMPDLTLERGEKLVYNFPAHETYTLSNNTIVSMAPIGGGSFEIVGMKAGVCAIELSSIENNLAVKYRGNIEVLVPIEQVICDEVRDEMKEYSSVVRRQKAAELLSRARSVYATRMQHTENLYRAFVYARQAWCVLEQAGGLSQTLIDAKETMDTAKQELDRNFRESSNKIKQYIEIRDWKSLKAELDYLLLLLPEKRDWRNQRAVKLKDFYHEELPRD